MTNEGIVSFDDWSKLDLRVAKIESVEDIEGADRLYKINLEVGDEIGSRVVCAGLKPFFEKDELEGKKVVFFANLQPRKMKGIESQGMILASDDGEGNVSLIAPERDAKVGSRIR